MHPILLDLPAWGIRLRAAETMVQASVIGVIACTLLFAWALERQSPRRVLPAMLVLAVVVLVGGRIHYVLNHWMAYSGQVLRAFMVWKGQFHIPGGMIALVLATPFVCRRFGIPTGKLADALAPAVGIGIVIARIGCLLQGCCYGDFCEGAWCMTFPAGSQAHELHWRTAHVVQDARASLPVHPLQLYFAAAGALIAAASLLLSRAKRYDGQVALLAMLVFSASSFGLEFLRNDFPPRRYWGSWPQLAWTTGAMTAASVMALAWAEVRHWRSARRTVAAPLLVSR